jgi:hypothetical protein
MSQNLNNKMSYGLFDAPSASAFFSLLEELEKDLANPEPDVKLFFPETAPMEYLNKLKSTDYCDFSGTSVDKDLSEEKNETANTCCDDCQEEECICHQIFSTCPSEGCKNKYNIYEAQECEECVRSKISICYCGNNFHIDEPYGMCGDCEMIERQQESIDKMLYPDDIDRYLIGSD